MVERPKKPESGKQERQLPPNRIAQARAARGWNQQQLAELIGTTQQTISRYETSQRDFGTSVVRTLCEVLEVPVSYLLCMDDEQPRTVEVPLFGSIAAGAPMDMEAADSSYPVPAIVHERFPRAFLLRIEGESMNNVLPNGCLALIDPCKDIDHEGQPYAVCVNELEATIKRVRHTPRGIELVPDSTDPSYHAQVLTPGASDVTVSIIGRVIWHSLPHA